ncbi:hypothetical protein [Methylomicrobium sp. Wu6]|uniref:hypothetical protein n=1 Tax=Methylomicrobium sp. Wu6 TaxID=3107928 RepID=UPI002DD69057|nr:hypothetical protein [Methylomicrobium sp. Wu6]MEC4747415.1 hypothetical protein [Methylomicrobium sp. Wu6]
MRRGTKADLARELGISRSAVSQAFKKHAIQLSTDGKFDLDYAAWLLREKQDAAKSKAQRSANKQLPGLKNPRFKREVVRLLQPVWDEAFRAVIREAVSGAENEEDWAYIEDYLAVFMLVWDAFHEICDREFPSDMGDFPFLKPACIDFDFTVIHPRDQITTIMQGDDGVTDAGRGKIDYSAMPLEELEPLVFGTDDALDILAFDLEADSDLSDDQQTLRPKS